jgi:hypothetical protein
MSVRVASVPCVLIPNFLSNNNFTLFGVPASNIPLHMVRERIRRAIQQRHAGQYRCISGRDAEDVDVSNVSVRMIDLLGHTRSISPIPAEYELRNATERDRANNRYVTNPFPSGRPKRQQPNTISQGGNSTDNEKRAGEVTVNAAAPGGIQQTYCAHEPE